MVNTRNLGASISSPLLSVLSTLRRAYGSWKLLRAALEKRCLRGGITGSMFDLQTSFLVHQVLCFRTTAQVDKKTIPMWYPQLKVGIVNLSLFCFLHGNKIVKVEWISPPGRVDLGRRLTLCPQKIATIKRHGYHTLPHGKGFSRPCPHARCLSNTVG